MNKITTTDHLVALHNELELSFSAMIAASVAVMRAEFNLANKEVEFILNGIIDGKNDMVRDAQLKGYTMEEREILLNEKTRLKAETVKYEVAKSQVNLAHVLVTLVEDR
jgi:hypothetical protein